MNDQQLNALAEEFQHPVQIGTDSYFLYQFIDIDEMKNKKYKLYYKGEVMDTFVQNVLVHRIFSILNRLNIFPEYIVCSIPDNKMTTQYFPYYFPCKAQCKFECNGIINGLKVKVPIENYIKLYEKRFRKYPLLRYEEQLQDLLIEYLWITSIVL